MEFEKVINIIYALFKKIYTYTQTYPYFVDNLSDFISISRGIVDITVDYISPLQI